LEPCGRILSVSDQNAILYRPRGIGWEVDAKRGAPRHYAIRDCASGQVRTISSRRRDRKPHHLCSSAHCDGRIVATCDDRCLVPRSLYHDCLVDDERLVVDAGVDSDGVRIGLCSIDGRLDCQILSRPGLIDDDDLGRSGCQKESAQHCDGAKLSHGFPP